MAPLDPDPRPSALSVREGHLAMYYFVETYFARGGRRNDGLVMLVTNLRPSDDPADSDALQTDDPAFWSDWLAAVETARREGTPPST